MTPTLKLLRDYILVSTCPIHGHNGVNSTILGLESMLILGPKDNRNPVKSGHLNLKNLIYKDLQEYFMDLLLLVSTCPIHGHKDLSLIHI